MVILLKKSLSGGKVVDLSSKINTQAFKCKKAVIHMGTNDITSDDSPKDIAFKLADETEKIKSVTQVPQVIISSIIKRKDVDVDPKIIETNHQLKQICSQRKWKFIDNDHIDDSCLNSSKLHLNKKGSTYLASNFLKKINPNQRNNTRSNLQNRQNGNFPPRNALLAALIQDLVQNQNCR